MKILDFKEKKEMIKKAICHYAAIKSVGIEEVFKVLSPYIDPNFIPDRELIMHKEFWQHIDWQNLDKQKVIRLIIRDESVLDMIDIEKYNLTFKELIPVFTHNPDLVDRFNINFDTLNAVQAINMIEINPNFIKNIDLDKYNYSKLQLAEIVRKFANNEHVMEKVSFDALDHFSIRGMLIKTGSKYIHKLDLDNLKAPDWIEILENRPELLDYCNLMLFEAGDCYLLTKLVLMFPALDYMIEESASKVSAIGWENLLINNPDRYQDVCDYTKLSRKNWDNIVRHHPHLEEKKRNYFIF
jgi:hypothetical protein